MGYDPNHLLDELRRLCALATEVVASDDVELDPEYDVEADICRNLRQMVEALDAHLSAGGTPPEAWREGPDAPADTARWWQMDADPGDDHPTPFPDTRMLVDEEAGGVVAYVSGSALAERIVKALS